MIHPTANLGLACFALALLIPAQTRAQREITMQPIVRIGGDAEAEKLILQNTSINRDSRGRFYLAPVSDPGEIAVFSNDGKLIRTIGREGAGPGEFQRLTSLTVGPGDSLYVFDRRRMSVLSPTYEFVRQVPFSGSLRDVLALGGGELLLATTVWNAKQVGYPLHVLGRSGIVRSFGETGQAVLSNEPWHLFRSVSGAGPGRFWVAYHNKFVIELWNVNGTREQRYSPSVPWFKAWDKPSGMWLADHVLGSVDEDDTGALWILSRLGDPSVSPISDTAEIPVSTRTACRQANWKLVAFDAKTLRPLAETTLDCPSGSLGNRTFYTRGETDIGVVYIDVFEVRLK